MFKSCFQGGLSVEVFSAQGKEPLSQWKQVGNNNIQKKFDKEVKSYVIHLEGSNTSTKMQLPKETKQTLGLSQRYVILQVFVVKDKDFCLDIGISLDGSSKRRLVLSTTHKETHVTALHSKLPMGVICKNVWLNLCFDLLSLVSDTWKGENYKCLESISIQGSCKLRRIFTMKSQPIDTTDDDVLYGCPTTNNNNMNFDSIPKQCVLAPDVRQMTQVINMPKLQCFEKKVRPQTSSRSASEQDLSSSLNTSQSQSRKLSDDHNHSHSKKHPSGSAQQLKKSESEKKDFTKDTDRRTVGKEEERKNSGKESERKVTVKDSERKGSGKETDRNLGLKESERKGSGKEGERRSAGKENGERKGSGKEHERMKSSHSIRAHHSRSKSDSVTGYKLPNLQKTDRLPPTSSTSKKAPSGHSPRRRAENSVGSQRERRDSDPGASQVDDDIVVDKDSLRSSHTWTDGADGKDQIPFVKPHPPSQPSSAKHRRPPRVKSAGKERTPHAGHISYKDSVHSGSSANTTPPNGEVEQKNPAAAPTLDEFQMADTNEMVDILNSMRRENGPVGESESDLDSVAELIGVLNNRTDENTAGEYEASEDSVLSDDKYRHEHKVYMYSSKPKEAPRLGEKQGVHPPTKLEPHTHDQHMPDHQLKSNRTRVRKKSHEKKRVRSRTGTAGVGGGDGQKPGGAILMKNGVMAGKNAESSDFVVNQSSDEDVPTPRAVKKNRSPRGKPLTKRSQNNPQYSNAIYNNNNGGAENRLQNNIVRISPLGKPLLHHHQGYSPPHKLTGDRNLINSSTYKVDPSAMMYNQNGLLQIPPMSYSPHLLQAPVVSGSRRSQTSTSFSKKSLREIPYDEIRRSGGSRAYNKDLYEMPEYLSESRERSMLQGMCSDDEMDELDEHNENDLTKKNEYHFTAGSSSEENTPQSTLKATIEKDHDYLEEMERNKFSDENPSTCSNPRLFSPEMFYNQEKNSPYQLSPVSQGVKVTTYNNSSSHNEQSSDDEELELLFDYILGCYFDPHTGVYYQLK